MFKLFFLLVSFLSFATGWLFAQETLPEFSVKNNNGKISVSWQNKFTLVLKSISVQRSQDSSKSYSSIYTEKDPNAPVNGYMDKNPRSNNMFYRLFIVFESGDYLFTESKRPELDGDFDLTKTLNKFQEKEKIIAKKNEIKEPEAVVKPKKKAEPEFTVITKKTYPDSDIETTDNLPVKTIVPYPSSFVFTEKDNNVIIELPDFKPGKYLVKIFDAETNSLLFELKNLTDSYLILEKVNFMHAGWFVFELYENGKRKEKNKFFIARD